MSKADEYFEQNGLRISSLSLLAIILPKRKPFKKFPRQNPVLFVCMKLEYYIEEMFFGYGSADDFMIECCARSIFPCALCCNFGLLIDNYFVWPVLDRMDMVRAVFLIYERVYRRRLEGFRCPLLCFCAANIGERRDYAVQEEEIFFVEWIDSNLTNGPFPIHRNLSSHDFVYFYIRGNIVVSTMEVFDTLKKYEREYFRKHELLSCLNISMSKLFTFE
eukprot:snap_masked-scaffold_56-processed-gene-0.35-mRNA-1 protein AED:1.00 eAED:1.00 QI:0/0/0/0/1/1/3/0/218